MCLVDGDKFCNISTIKILLLASTEVLNDSFDVKHCQFAYLNPLLCNLSLRPRP